MNDDKDTSELRYSTETNEGGKWIRPEEPEARPVIRRKRRLTHNERWLTPSSNTTPKAHDLPVPHQLSPEMLEFVMQRLDDLEEFDIRFSDCIFNPDGSVVIPNSPKKRDPNAR
jgi:hypothetical protein